MDFNEVTFHYIECIHFYSQNSQSQVKKMEHSNIFTILLYTVCNQSSLSDMCCLNRDNKSVISLNQLTPRIKVDQTQTRQHH